MSNPYMAVNRILYYTLQ